MIPYQPTFSWRECDRWRRADNSWRRPTTDSSFNTPNSTFYGHTDHFFHYDLFEVFKEMPTEELSEANSHLLNDISFIWFTDEKTLRLATPDCMHLLQQRKKTLEQNAFFAQERRSVITSSLMTAILQTRCLTIPSPMADRWVGQNSGPILRRVWTKVYRIKNACAEVSIVYNAVFRLTISCCVPEIFAIKSRSCAKSRRSVYRVRQLPAFFAFVLIL